MTLQRSVRVNLRQEARDGGLRYSTQVVQLNVERMRSGKLEPSLGKVVSEAAKSQLCCQETDPATNACRRLRTVECCHWIGKIEPELSLGCIPGEHRSSRTRSDIEVGMEPNLALQHE